MTSAYSLLGHVPPRLAISSPPAISEPARVALPLRKIQQWLFASFLEPSLRSQGMWLCSSQAPRVEETLAIGQTLAIFRQINKDRPHTHHDALEFPDGRTALLTMLGEGQEATVLQLPAQPTTAAEEEAQTRVAWVG